MIGNVAVLLPAGTVTEAETATAEVLELLMFTTKPSAGEAALNVTFPVEISPPTTLVGVSLRESILLWVTRSETCLEMLFREAVSITEVSAKTVVVDTLNEAVILPA